MPTFTLDTNCILAIENDEPSADSIRALVDAHTEGRSNVAVVAISASENQRDRRQLENFSEFKRRLARAGLGDLEILHAMLYLDITYWDWCVIADDAMVALEKRIHDILFPNVQFLWRDYCDAHDLQPTRLDARWRNCKCDVLALWSHIHRERQVFVTNDARFHAESKKPLLIELGAGRIETPETAVTLI